MSARYAADTSVSVERSKAEIEATLARYGADQFMSGWERRRAVIAFRMKGRFIRFELPLPDPDAPEFKMTPSRKWERSESEQQKAYEQACRSRWRALGLVIKAKLEAIETGITTFDDEFMAFIQLPSGGSVGDWMKPQIEQAYLTGEMPSLLPALPAPKDE